MPSHVHFEIDIISAVSGQLVAAFSKIDIEPLTSAKVNSLPKGPGVYNLYHHGSLVYVGKADGLKERLGEHWHKISERLRIEVADIGFKCVFMHPNWMPLACEDSLIKYYRKTGEGACACAWNRNGFGSHDPGRKRETTNQASATFDAQYPIR